METKINTISNSEHELEVTLTYNEIQTDLDEAYKNESRKIELPGFRKGKVPMSMIKKMYGEAIEYQASEKIAGKKFWEIVDDQKLNPISTPKIMDINFEKGIKLSFKIRYEVMPVIDVKDYTGNEIKKIIWEVNDEMVNEEIFSLQRTNAVEEDAEIIEDSNHLFNAKIRRTDAGLEDKAENLTLDLSDKRMSPQVSEKAIGKKVGEVFSFAIPSQHVKEVDGEKKVVSEEIEYEAEVLSVKKIKLPELTDEFVQKITNNKFKTADEWKENIRSGLKAYFDRQSEEMLINSLISTVLSNNKFDPPHGYVHILLDRMVESEAEKAKREGNKKIDTNELHHRLHPRAEYSAKWQILSKSIAEKENIKVDEDQLNELAEKESAETGISKEKLVKFYKDTNRLEIMLEDKIIDFLKNNNNIVEVKPEDLNKNKTAEG